MRHRKPIDFADMKPPRRPACEELAELLVTVDTRSIDLDADDEIVLRQPWGAISWELYCESGDLAQFLTLESAEMAQRALGRTLERLTAIVEHQASRYRLPHYHLALGGPAAETRSQR